MSPAGTMTAGLVAGGYSPPGSPNYGNVVTEEWTNGPATFGQLHEGQLFYNSTGKTLLKKRY